MSTSVTEPQPKRQKVMSKVCPATRFLAAVIRDRCQVIGTHNGTFHCDEALAVFLLKQTEAYRDAGSCLAFAACLVRLIHAWWHSPCFIPQMSSAPEILRF